LRNLNHAPVDSPSQIQHSGRMEERIQVKAIRRRIAVKECAPPVLALLQAVSALAGYRSRRNHLVTDLPQSRPGRLVVGGATRWQHFALFPVFPGMISTSGEVAR
jgi:hypothetical protein